MLHVGGESDPAGGVHVDMFLVCDVLLINLVRVNSLPVVLSPQDVVECFLKVFAVTTQIFTSVLSKQQQLSLMRLKIKNVSIFNVLRNILPQTWCDT